MSESDDDSDSGTSQSFLEEDEDDLADGDRVKLGNPDMEEVESIASDEEEELDEESGRVTRKKGGITREELEKKMKNSKALQDLRQQQTIRFRYYCIKTVRLYMCFTRVGHTDELLAGSGWNARRGQK